MGLSKEKEAKATDTNGCVHAIAYDIHSYRKGILLWLYKPFCLHAVPHLFSWTLAGS